MEYEATDNSNKGNVIRSELLKSLDIERGTNSVEIMKKKKMKYKVKKVETAIQKMKKKCCQKTNLAIEDTDRIVLHMEQECTKVNYT